ncbi:MAG: LysR family transcriptional regulator [Blastocatellia bacterium]|nr:LysR family transcriptional regulator [Blastocatellia bacterium]
MRTFHTVAETLNFTRAAERLHINQSAVSHQIKALETELGEPLFIRAKRGVTLSHAGRIALEYVKRILGESEACANGLPAPKPSFEGPSVRPPQRRPSFTCSRRFSSRSCGDTRLSN